MQHTPEEQAVLERFAHRYEFAESELLLEIQRSACGCDYGATSWTTGEEARTMFDMLELRRGMRLLEVGTGAGWPGLYLAGRAGCDAALVDLPLSGLKALRNRARRDARRGACWAVAGDGAALPFAERCFDAIVHSDVLCCLVAKLDVLRACRRTIRAHGNLVFSVILIAPGLSDAHYREAIAGGPPFVESPLSYAELLERSGWLVRDRIDLTSRYEESLRAIMDLEAQHREALIRLLGAQYVADASTRRRGSLNALRRGLIRRELYHAVPRGAVASG